MYSSLVKPLPVRVSAPLLALLLAVSVRVMAADVSPQELVRDTSSRMLLAMHEEHDIIEKDAAHLYLLVEEIVLPYFDFQRMSQWVLGKNWRNAPAHQREQFVEQFRMLLVGTYGSIIRKDGIDRLIHQLADHNRLQSDG
jgi:phospholipid transport system substrate-binding protein